jgi:hypothetical protein
MLNSLVLNNFRCFGQRTTIHCAPITVMFGKNSAGKSSIISSLLLLKQSLVTGDDEGLLRPRTERGPADLGSMREIMYGHDIDRSLEITLRCSFDRRRIGNEHPYLFPRRETAGAIQPPEQFTYGWTFDLAKPSRELVLTALHVAQSDQFSAVFRRTLVPGGDEPLYALRTSANDMTIVDTVSEHAARVIHTQAENLRARLMNVEVPLENLGRLSYRLRRMIDDSGRMHDEAVRILRAAEAAESRLDDASFCRGLYLEDQARAGFVGDGLFPTERTYQQLFPRLYDLLDWKSLGSPRDGSRGLRTSDAGLFDIVPATSQAARCIRNTLASLVPIGPLRERPSRLYMFSGSTPGDVGYDGRRVPDLLFRDPELLHEANEWLQKLEVPYRIEPQSLLPAGSSPEGATTGVYELRLRDIENPNGPLVSMSDVGFGVSQILPIIAQILLSRDNLITVEQPELHVHPGLQARLADLFIAAIKPPYRHQFIIETHSEHFALRLQKRLGEKQALCPEDVSFLFVRRTGDGSRVLHIPLDEAGNLTERPPGGFFLERLQEL